MIPSVRGVTAASTSPASRQNVSSMSTKTGLAPQWISGSIVGNAVCEGTITSSPAFSPCARCVIYTIIVHDEPSTQCGVPACAASSASNAWHSLPRMYCPERNARSAASSTSPFTKHFDNGIFCIKFISFQLHPLSAPGGLQGRVHHPHRLVPRPAVRQRLLPRLRRFHKRPQLRQQRLLRRALDLAHRPFHRFEIVPLPRVPVLMHLDFILRRVVIAHRAAFLPRHDHFPGLSRRNIIILPPLAWRVCCG